MTKYGFEGGLRSPRRRRERRPGRPGREQKSGTLGPSLPVAARPPRPAQCRAQRRRQPHSGAPRDRGRLGAGRLLRHFPRHFCFSFRSCVSSHPCGPVAPSVSASPKRCSSSRRRRLRASRCHSPAPHAPTAPHRTHGPCFCLSGSQFPTDLTRGRQGVARVLSHITATGPASGLLALWGSALSRVRLPPRGPCRHTSARLQVPQVGAGSERTRTEATNAMEPYNRAHGPWPHESPAPPAPTPHARSSSSQGDSSFRSAEDVRVCGGVARTMALDEAFSHALILWDSMDSSLSPLGFFQACVFRTHKTPARVGGLPAEREGGEGVGESERPRTPGSSCPKK